MTLKLRMITRFFAFVAVLGVVFAGSAVAFAGPAVDAARKGDVKKLKALLAQDPKLVNEKDNNGDAPLHQAALHGQVAAVQFLLESGADVNAKNSYGAYLPGDYWAAVSGASNQTDPVKILFAPGNNDEYRKNGYTPLHLAVFSTNHKKIVDLLVAKGANVNDQSASGATPLLFAVMRGQKDDVTYLLDHGANPNLADAYGDTPLMCALQTSYQSLVQPLVDKGADVNAVAQDTKRPLSFAMSNSKLDSSVITLLKKHGAHE
jgi:ankyrin repeat protein